VEEEDDLVARGEERKQAGVRDVVDNLIVVDEGGPWDAEEGLQLWKGFPVLSPVDDVVGFGPLERNLEIHEGDGVIHKLLKLVY
jgi:hypothetical protein